MKEPTSITLWESYPCICKAIECWTELDRAGPSGMIQAVCQDPYWHFYSLVILQEFHQYINGLDYRKKRLMLKGLDNSGSVVSVMLDDGSIRKVK